MSEERAETGGLGCVCFSLQHRLRRLFLFRSVQRQTRTDAQTRTHTVSERLFWMSGFHVVYCMCDYDRIQKNSEYCTDKETLKLLIASHYFDSILIAFN